jgi:hypothetical protein
MTNQPSHQRPPFNEALKAWTGLLRQRGLPSECVWLFEENLCFEKDAAASSGFRVSFQTSFTPAPPDVERIAYDYFADFAARLVFYRLGSAGAKSLCLILCDAWFDSRGETDGYVRRDEWLISFRPGGNQEIEELQDPLRWKQRLLRDRSLHDLDFCMTLRSVHEILAHGRVLTSYEHYALRFLHLWQKLLGGHS